MKWARPGMRALVLVAAIATVLLGASNTATAADSSWMQSGAVTKTLVADNIPQESPYYDKQCTRISQQENKYKFTGYPTYKWVQDGKTEILNGCWTKTKYGLFGSTRDGWYMRTQDYGAVTMFEDWRLNAVPIPNSDKLLRKYSNGTSSTWGLYLYEDAKNAFTIVNRGTKDMYLASGQPRMRILKDPARDEPLYVNSVGVSNNGRYLAIEGPTFYRYDLQTDEILAFEKPKYAYGYGLNPGYELSISNDGRYATISGGNIYSSLFTIHDLSTCSQIPGKTFEVASTCKARDLKSELFPSSPANTRPSKVVFSDDGKNVSLNMLENGKTNHYTLTIPGENQPLLEYLALGDSFSSGEGDEDDLHYLSGTNGGGEIINNTGIANFPYWREKCHLSDRSYSYLLGNVLNNKFRSVACSGADLKDVLDIRSDGTKDNRYNGHFDHMDELINSSLKEVKLNALSSFTPGRAAQIEFVQKYKPRVVTIGIGGNDIQFGKKLAECVPTLTTCRYASTHRAETAQEISQLYEKLVHAYAQLKNASPTTRFYAVGYPQLVTSGGQCQANVLLDEYEREYATQVVSYLNKTIAAAAARADMEYLAIDDALAGHNLCSSAEKIAVNGLMAGDDRLLSGGDSPIFGFIGNESYHPNQIGHELMAAAIRAKLQNEAINTFNPCAPSTSLTCSTTNGDKPTTPAYFNTTGKEISVISGMLSTGDALLGLAGDFFKRSAQISIDSIGQTLKPLTQAEISLFSSPVSLGTATVDVQGNLASTVTIPANTEPGYHTIHVFGTAPSGEKVDYYKNIFVYANETDWDGDGILNQNDKCGLVDPVNIDKDKDGVDDACDGFVGDPKPKLAAVASSQANSVQGFDGQIQSAKSIYTALSPNDAVSLGFVAGASTTPVNYLDGPGGHADVMTAERIENMALIGGSVLLAALLGSVTLIRFVIQLNKS